MDATSGPRVPRDDAVLLGQVARALSGRGEHALPEVLDLLVTALGLRGLVLRDAGPGGAPRAVAGDVVRAVRPAAGADGASTHSVDLDVVPHGRTAAVLTAVGSRPSTLPVLRAAADLIALALSAPRRAEPVPPAPQVVDAVDAELDAVADALHDGPVQALVAARYAVDLAARGGDAADVRGAVQEALVSLRRSLWHVRPRGGAGLLEGLSALSGRLVEAGSEPLPELAGADLAGALSPQAASVAYRLVQAVVLAEPDRPVGLRLHRRGDVVVLEVTGPGVEQDVATRHAALAGALGGTLVHGRDRVRLALPAVVAAVPLQSTGLVAPAAGAPRQPAGVVPLPLPHRSVRPALPVPPLLPADLEPAHRETAPRASARHDPSAHLDTKADS